MKNTELRIGYFLGYKVREDGIIYSKKNGKPLKYTLNDKGYPSVSLSNCGKAVFRRVHRVVAIVFIPNLQNKPCVNHKDRNRGNYNISNLEWATHSENAKHSVVNGGRKGWTRNNIGMNNPNCKIKWHTVNAIRDLYDMGTYSQNKLSDIFGIGQGSITKIVNYKTWISEN